MHEHWPSNVDVEVLDFQVSCISYPRLVVHVMVVIEISVNYSISFNGSSPWKVASSLVKEVDGLNFINLKPHDGPLVRFVVDGEVELEKKTSYKYSLAHTAGFIKLKELRNDAAKFQESPEKPAPENSAGLVGLFGAAALKAPQVKRGPRYNASQLQELRESPKVMEFEVPGVGGNPGLMVSCLQPAHPSDHLWARLDADTLQHIVLFIRD